jgi:type III secretion protein C
MMAWAFAFAVMAAAPMQVAAQLPTQSNLYRYQAVNRDLTDVLRGFAADQRLNLVLDPGIARRLVSEEVEMPPTQFLDYITGKYGLVWYFDGVSLYVYRSDQLATDAFPLRYTTIARVVEVMKSLRAYSDRYPYRVLEKENVILAVAPPRMLQMTSFVVGTLEAREKTAASAQIGIAVIELEYASAADQTFQFVDGSVTVPGVASILQSVVSGQAIPGRMTAILPRNLQKLKGQGLDRFSSDQPRPAPQTLQPPLAPPSQPLSSSPEGPPGPAEQLDDGYNDSDAYTGPNAIYNFQPTITADPRSNSVIIHDHPDRIASYQQVVKALDRPSGLIEISARIIDVSKEGGFEWGWPFSTQWRSGGQQQGFSIQLTSTDAANFGVTLLRDQVADFVHTIKALEQEGHAKVTSRPTLLTMDNVEAQINNSETFYVEVEGSYEVDLFDVSAGTKLKILPHIIEKDGQRVIKLSVQIDNGGILEQTVNEIPRVRNDSLTTQAVLRENESLLIGGLIREERSVTESRVPVLGRLPHIGFLFRTEERNLDSVERLILIEPRIVAYVNAQEEQLWIQSAMPAGDAGASRPVVERFVAPPVRAEDVGMFRPPIPSSWNESPQSVGSPVEPGRSNGILPSATRIRKFLTPRNPFRHSSLPELPTRSGMNLLPGSQPQAMATDGRGY